MPGPNPNTIHLGGTMVLNDSFVAGEAGIRPGMHIELYTDNGRKKWRKVASATEITNITVALDQPLMNRDIDHEYPVGSQVNAATYGPGGLFYGLVPSGQDISNGELMSPNGGGTGMFKSSSTTTAAGNVSRLRAYESIGLVAETTRVRLEVLY